MPKGASRDCPAPGCPEGNHLPPPSLILPVPARGPGEQLCPLISSVPLSQWDSCLSQGIDARKNLGDRKPLAVQIWTLLSEES